MLETHHVLKMRDVYNSTCILSTRQPIYIISKRIMPRDEHLRGGYTKAGDNANVLLAKCSICPLKFYFSRTSSCKEGHDLCQGHPDVVPRLGAPPALAPCAWSPLRSWRAVDAAASLAARGQSPCCFPAALGVCPMLAPTAGLLPRRDRAILRAATRVEPFAATAASAAPDSRVEGCLPARVPTRHWHDV